MFAACIALTFILGSTITGSRRCSSSLVTKPLLNRQLHLRGLLNTILPESLAPAPSIADVRRRLAKCREGPRYSAVEWVLAIRCGRTIHATSVLIIPTAEIASIHVSSSVSVQYFHSGAAPRAACDKSLCKPHIFTCRSVDQPGFGRVLPSEVCCTANNNGFNLVCWRQTGVPVLLVISCDHCVVVLSVICCIRGGPGAQTPVTEVWVRVE